MTDYSQIEVTEADQRRLGRIGAFDAATAQLRDVAAAGADGEPFSLVFASRIDAGEGPGLDYGLFCAHYHQRRRTR